jgi:general stress protein 26
MPNRSLSDIADKMKSIDIAMMATMGADGSISSRPMSNNGEVEYDGDSYYFTYERSRVASEIEADPAVTLTFDDGEGFWLVVNGDAELIRDKAAFQERWNPDLERWFEQGVDTPGMVLIKVIGRFHKFWDGEEQGEATRD